MAIGLIISVYYIKKNIEKVYCNLVTPTLLLGLFGFITQFVSIIFFSGGSGFFL